MPRVTRMAHWLADTCAVTQKNAVLQLLSYLAAVICEIQDNFLSEIKIDCAKKLKITN